MDFLSLSAQNLDEKQEKNSQNFVKSLDFKFVRNLPLAEIQKIVKRRSELCNWCGIEKKVYLCCEEGCLRKQFFCSQCSIQWMEHPHFMHQFIYIIPLLSHNLTFNHNNLINAYKKLKTVEIKTNLNIIKELLKFQPKLEEQMRILEEQRLQIQRFLKKIEENFDNDETEMMKQIVKEYGKIVELVRKSNVGEKLRILKELEKKLIELALGGNSERSLGELRNGGEIGTRVSVQVESEEFITSKSIINFKNQTENYQKLSRFYSNGLKGMAIKLISPVQKIRDSLTLHLFNNITTLHITGQLNLQYLIVLLANQNLRCLKIDYIITSEQSSLKYFYPSLLQEQTMNPRHGPLQQKKFRKLYSNLVHLEIMYPSIKSISSVFSFCQFPHLCRIILHEIYETKQKLASFLRDLLMRVSRLQFIELSTHLEYRDIEEIAKATLQYRVQNHLDEDQNPPVYRGGMSKFGTWKKRYQIKCISKIDVMVREMRLDGHIVIDNDLMLQEEDRERMESKGWVQKTKALLILACMYKKKSSGVNGRMIKKLLQNDIL